MSAPAPLAVIAAPAAPAVAQPGQPEGVATRSALAPAPEIYGEQETLAVVDLGDPYNSTFERFRLVRSSLKYPLLRVEERFLRDPASSAEPVLLERIVMVADHVLVQAPANQSAAAFRSALAKKGFNASPVSPGSPTWRVSIPAKSLNDMPVALAALRADAPPGMFAEADYLVFHSALPNDPLLNQLWGLRNTGQTGGTPQADIDATGAWTITTGSPSVLVAVIDSGVDYLHPDLSANIYSNPGETVDNADSDGNGYVDDVRGWNFYANTNNPMDDHFHGTHVAGTIGARGGNAEGVSGVAWQVRLLPLKFLSSTGSGFTSDAIAAIRYATAAGARISCNSWGGGGYSRALEQAIEEASAAGSLFVAAAGNSSQNNDVRPTYPASYQVANIVSVAASDHNDRLAGFSNFGAGSVHLAAPGVGILSTFPRSVTSAMFSSGLPAAYGRISGTSMATPHVAGAAALILASEPGLSLTQLRGRLLSRSQFIPALQPYLVTGARLNVGRAVNPNWTPAPAEPLVEALVWNDTGGNGNGLLEPGENIRLVPALINAGGSVASNVIATLQILSGPAETTAPVQFTRAELAPYQRLNSAGELGMRVLPAASDGDLVRVRVNLTWTGGADMSYEASLPIVKPQPQASREVNFSIGEIAADPGRNLVYLVSPSAWRVIAINTETHAVSSWRDLDQTQLQPELRTTGGMAVSADGQRLYVALTGTRRIQVLSLPTLAPLTTLITDFDPVSLAFDVHGRLFATSSDYWGPLRQVNPATGKTLEQYDKGTVNGSFYRNALLRMDHARQRLFLGETGLRTAGGPSYVYEWNVSGATPAFVKGHPMVQIFLNDFQVDTENGQLLSMHGGIYGVQVTSLADGTYGQVWPLHSPYGRAIAGTPGMPITYAGSGDGYDGVIRRFALSDGRNLGAYPVLPENVTASLMPRGLAMTPNGAVLSVSSQWTGSTNTGVAGTRFFINLTGTAQLDVTLPPPTPIPARLLLAKIDTSDLGGNGDGFANPGELVHLAPFITNAGEAPSAPVEAELISLNAGAVVQGAATRAVPAIASTKTAAVLPAFPVQLAANLAPDTLLDFRLVLRVGDGAEQSFAHRLTVRALSSGGPGTPNHVSSDLQFSGIAANPQLNEAYLIDKRFLRVLAFDTGHGAFRAARDIPVTPRLVNGLVTKLG
jgi:subtilisin family serine protease